MFQSMTVIDAEFMNYILMRTLRNNYIIIIKH